jgi:hypothetical protein
LKDASCKDCANRTDEDPPFCTWLKAEVPVDLADDPECEGFVPKDLRTRKARKGLRKLRKSCPDCEVSENARPKKTDIESALKLKELKGSIVLERISCGKNGCRCTRGQKHGPYKYLHFWQGGKVKRRYLSKTVSALVWSGARAPC